MLSLCKLNSISYHFSETRPGSCSHSLSFVQAWPSTDVRNPMTSYLFHDLIVSTRPRTPTSPPPSPHHIAYLVFSRLLKVFTSGPVLIPPILFLCTPGNPWLMALTFWLIALSLFCMGHCMERRVITKVKTNVVNHLPPFLNTALYPAPSHFIRFLRS